MVYNLYFENSKGEQKLIRHNAGLKDNIYKNIVDTICDLNPSYSIPYMRSWTEEDGTVIYDVGSWSEFFKLIPIKQEEKE